MREDIKKVIIDALGKPNRTNCYMTFGELERKFGEKRLELVWSKDLVIFVEKKNRYYELYYFLNDGWEYFSDWDIIKVQLNKYDMISLQTVNRSLDGDCYIAEKLAFYYYKTYLRKQYINKTLQKYNESIDVDWAVEEDNRIILDLLYETFDVLSDNLVDEFELTRMIRGQQVLKIEIAGKIQGVILFEDVGVKSYVRAVCVAKSVQNKGLGHALLARYYNLHLDKTKLFYLWVDRDNKNAMKLYDKFGYKSDGLVNHIYIREK